MIVTANEYLDVRRPEWRVYEREGRIVYDPVARVVRVAASLSGVLVELDRS